MNEEEIIKILKDTISLFNSDTHCFIYSENERVEALRGLLDLYQKEKEKNRLLIEGKFREVADKNSYIKDNYISKDKVRDLLEQFRAIKKEILKLEHELGRASITYDIVRNDYCEKILEKLLGE